MPSALCANAADDHRLDISFLFHFNQDLVPEAKVAAIAGYVGLLEVLRAHPDLPFQIQISGTLLNSLMWFDPRPIELIREGVESGQFEILGSTYSQNVMHASDDPWTNGKQIQVHRELLNKYFDVKPAGFWNPERVWTQSFVELLTGYGYDYTMVESHILRHSGITGPLDRVRKTRLGSDSLFVVHDNERFKEVFDQTVRGLPIDSLLFFLTERYEADAQDEFLVAYFQDAEATGFWQYGEGKDPAPTWRRLDTLLTVLKSTDWINVTTAERFLKQPRVYEEVSPIADGQAAWMIDFAKAAGYEDWYDYLARDSLIQDFRTVLDEVRDSLRAVEQTVVAAAALPAARHLFERAVRTFVSHEYEFGASWYWTPYWSDFYLAREALVSLRAVRHAAASSSSSYLKDINRDGVEEIVLVDPENMVVLTPFGGRLLYWFDLAAGETVVGNENFSYYFERYVDGGRYIPPLRGTKEVFPYRRHNAVYPEIFDMSFQIRRRALNDWLYVGGKPADSLVFARYDFELGQHEVRFTYDGGGFSISKVVGLRRGNSIEVSYVIRNLSNRAQAVTFVVENGLSPSYISIMDGGPSVLEYRGGAGSAFDPMATRGVRNVETGATLYFEFADDPFYMESEPVVFGLELNPRYEFRIEPGQERSLRFALKRTRD
ncbi:MAG TPA: hypothetical protein VGA18_02915 [Rhodothermales bacterium]